MDNAFLFLAGFLAACVCLYLVLTYGTRRVGAAIWTIVRDIIDKR